MYPLCDGVADRVRGSSKRIAGPLALFHRASGPAANQIREARVGYCPTRYCPTHRSALYPDDEEDHEADEEELGRGEGTRAPVLVQ